MNNSGTVGRRRGLTAILCSALLTGACDTLTPAAETTTVSLLLYDEQEAGIEPYPVRVMVSPEFIRFDDGHDAGDFMLIERASRTVYNVSHEERSILVIAPPPAAAGLPEGLALSETRATDTAAPLIAGRQPVHIRYLANGETCYEAVVVPELLPEAAAGLAEFAVILGERQLDDLESVPAEMQTPCFLARYAYAPARHLRDGLPVQEWDTAGYRRTLTDFRAQATVSPDLFELPLDYNRFQPGSWRSAGSE